MAFFVCVFIGVMLAGGGSAVRAMKPSWVDGEPMIRQTDDPYAVAGTRFCPIESASIKVSWLIRRQSACVFGDEAIRLALFNENNGPRAVGIAFGVETTYQKLRGVCETDAACLYSASQDVIIERYQASRYSMGVRVFKKVTDRLHFEFDPQLGIMVYRFDSTAPDYVMATHDGVAIGANGLAVSRGGDWAVIEAPSKGIMTIHIPTLTVRRVSAPGYGHGFGMDPATELAISNDGQSVAVAGVNAGIVLIEVTDSCGQVLSGYLADEFPAGTEKCRQRAVGPALLAPGFSYGSRPMFDNAGELLRFTAWSTQGRATAVNLFAAGTVPAASIDYLALGDSFQSGQGETDGQFYAPFTNDAYENCHLSWRSYPFLFGQLATMSPHAVRSVACSGATMKDVNRNAHTYWGQGERLGNRGRNVSEATLKQEQAVAMALFYPGRVPQIDFVTRYQPALISFGIGGNDADLMGKLKSCAMPGTCEWASTSESLAKMAYEIKALFDPLVATYKNIRQASPGSTLLIVGYPQILDPEGVCDPFIQFAFSQQERVFLRETLSYLNDVIQAATRAAGVRYIDMQDSLERHVLCGGEEPAATNGLRLVGDVFWVWPLPVVKIIGSESVHPTPFGNQLMARRLYDSFLQGLPPCHGYCPSDIEAPQPPPYWMVGEQPPAVRQISYGFTHEYIDSRSSKAAIQVSATLFRPNTEVTVEIHSSAIQIGHLRTDTAGAIDQFIALPESLEQGYHTLHLFGVSPSGESIDVYQTVAYVSGSEQGVADGVATSPYTSTATAAYADTGGDDSRESLAKFTDVFNSQAGVQGAHIYTLSKDTTQDLRQYAVKAERSNNLWWLAVITACFVSGIVAVGFIWRAFFRKRGQGRDG